MGTTALLIFYGLGYLVTCWLFLTDRVPDTLYVNLEPPWKYVYVFACALLWPVYLLFFVFVVLFVLGDF